MKIRCGTDLVTISRIEKAARRLGDRFLTRIWTAQELTDCLQDGQWHQGTAASLAARFAAKEAMAKALGTGVGRQGIRWTDLSVRKDALDAPIGVLSGAAKRQAQDLGLIDLSLSLSHEGDWAQAFCVILTEPNQAADSRSD